MSIEVEENKDAISNLPAVEKRFQFKGKRFSNSTGSYNMNVTESPSEFKSKLKKWRELSDYSKSIGKGNQTPETTRIPKVSAYKKRTSTLPEVSESNKSKLWSYYGIGKFEVAEG